MDCIKLDRIDSSFDRYSICPLVSTFSGAGRALYGVVELISGLVSAIWAAIAMACRGRCEQDAPQFNSACLHLFFGGANIVKGLFEAIPIVNFLVAGYNHDFRPLNRCDWTEFQPATNH